MRTVVVGASSGLGRCIGGGLAKRGAQVALLARRRARLHDAVGEAGPGALAIECDVVDAKSCAAAIGEAAERLGGGDPPLFPTGNRPPPPARRAHPATSTRPVGARPP